VSRGVRGKMVLVKYDSSTRSKFTQPVVTQAKPLVPVDDSKEPVRYRSAALMFLASLAIITLFCYLAGMSTWAVAVFYAL